MNRADGSTFGGPWSDPDRSGWQAWRIAMLVLLVGCVAGTAVCCLAGLFLVLTLGS